MLFYISAYWWSLDMLKIPRRSSHSKVVKNLSGSGKRSVASRPGASVAGGDGSKSDSVVALSMWSYWTQWASMYARKWREQHLTSWSHQSSQGQMQTTSSYW